MILCRIISHYRWFNRLLNIYFQALQAGRNQAKPFLKNGFKPLLSAYYVFACITQPHMSFFPSFLIMGGVLGLCGDTALDLKIRLSSGRRQLSESRICIFLVAIFTIARYS
jgi:hypothetical protein